jgi:hypothetical protein
MRKVDAVCLGCLLVAELLWLGLIGYSAALLF